MSVASFAGRVVAAVAAVCLLTTNMAAAAPPMPPTAYRTPQPQYPIRPAPTPFPEPDQAAPPKPAKRQAPRPAPAPQAASSQAAGQTTMMAATPAPPSPALQSLVLRPDQVAAMQRALADAESHGLPAGLYRTDDLAQQLMALDPQARRAAELRLLTRAARYAQAVHAGRLPTAQYMKEWGLRPSAYNASAELAAAVTGDRLAAWLDGLPPPYAGYQVLRRGLTTYRQIAANGGWETIPAGPDLGLGATGPRVIVLRARLAAEDNTVALAGEPVFDDALAQGVMRAQKRFGLEPTAVVNKATLAALNLPVEERVNQIEANMERWRWMPADLPNDRIQVNIAAAVLTVFKGDNPILSMRAVTGRPGNETPMLQSQIHSVVLNPPWNVPSSIAANELWPKERARPGYLKANDFIIIPTEGGGSRLQQKAGPKAALGRVKFDFSNPYGVYLHDTPTRSTFNRYGRLASHGCVRLEKPELLAKTVFAGDPQWTPEAIDATVASGQTVRASLQQSIAVYLFYWTAYVAPDGQVNFRQDPYGWDKELVRRLAALPSGSA